MGKYSILKQLSADRRRRAAYKSSKSLQQWYASNIVSQWQRERVDEIRAMYETKQRGLNAAHDIASAQLSVEYMEYELEYLETSQRLKNEQGGKPYHKDWRAIFSGTFWRNKLYGKPA